MSAAYDWTRFVARINIQAPVEKLYKAWATRGGMEFWFLRLSEYKNKEGVLRGNDEGVQAGDGYTWLWHGWSDDTIEHGSILEANGIDTLKFSFGKAGNCSIKIFRDVGETFVEITQDNIPDDDHGRYYWHLGCKTGWTFYLANMKSLYEGGIDLRNKNELLQGLINA